ncbi:MAG: glycosyl hydrolase [Pegethrix bostrychoides GSE-TBD4-15B]|jgi:endoglucanase|uniref:Glycosyl hydrolase n=1 Tax=Pegethrix bostrychoides GSE-TBD4-15B TaxID=2839662 RepID=A0A951PGS9_9CYAN|nr:glycosyl hydrolase [Pegethrix bostrychoides GSE-TBD4-15B]
MRLPRVPKGLTVLTTVLTIGLCFGCVQPLLRQPAAKSQPNQTHQTNQPQASYQPIADSTAASPELLLQSWQLYRGRFIQGDGRIIDREADDRSTSEGQAYALLRAVWIDDQESFELVLQWSEVNLQRPGGADHLWAWKWGQQPNESWGLLDPNFASDGDIDAITALILASRRWNQPQYLELARQKLRDLWDLSTVAAADSRYLLPGPKAAFQPQPNQVILNPSYFAPYAFRLFAEVDSRRDWLSLVDSSYAVLESSSQLSASGLPSDWVQLDLATGQVQPSDLLNLPSRYGFDAYRVWWRVALDAAWFDAPRARQYLQRLQPIRQQWQAEQKLVAQIDLQGQPLVSYESTAQYAMLYAAFRVVDPETAVAIYQQELLPAYRDGFWDHESAYYVQNLSWLGLFPVEQLPPDWFSAELPPDTT